MAEVGWLRSKREEGQVSIETVLKNQGWQTLYSHPHPLPPLLNYGIYFLIGATLAVALLTLAKTVIGIFVAGRPQGSPLQDIFFKLVQGEVGAGMGMGVGVKGPD